MAAVLKTVVGQLTGGSNPSLSASPLLLIEPAGAGLKAWIRRGQDESRGRHDGEREQGGSGQGFHDGLLLEWGWGWACALGPRARVPEKGREAMAHRQGPPSSARTGLCPGQPLQARSARSLPSASPAGAEVIKVMMLRHLLMKQSRFRKNRRNRPGNRCSGKGLIFFREWGTFIFAIFDIFFSFDSNSLPIQEFEFRFPVRKPVAPPRRRHVKNHPYANNIAILSGFISACEPLGDFVPLLINCSSDQVVCFPGYSL